MSKGMTLKGFVRKATAAKSAIGFLDAQKEFIRQHSFLTPTLEQYESGKVAATNALIEIRDIAFKHMMNDDIEKARKASEKTPREKTAKKYTATIFHKEGSQVVAGEDKDFDILQDADGWVDRKLFADASTIHAEIVSNGMLNKNGGAIKFTTFRQDAIARVLRSKKSAVSKSQRSTGALSFRPKVKNDVAHFSRG